MSKIFSLRNVLIANVIVLVALTASTAYFSRGVKSFNRELDVVGEKAEISRESFDKGYEAGIRKGKIDGSPLIIREDGAGNLRIENYSMDRYIAERREHGNYSSTRPAIKQELDNWHGLSGIVE